MSKELLRKFLQDQEGLAVHVNIKGAITVPKFIHKFEHVIDEKMFCFGENGCENFDFEIHWDTIRESYIRDEWVKLVLEDDESGLITILEIMRIE